MSPPHFRIVLPADYKYKKHTARNAKTFMSVEGEEEVEITQQWPILSFETVWAIDDVIRLKLEMAGSVEVQYDDERGSTP
jgi:hypothetical protein